MKKLNDAIHTDWEWLKVHKKCLIKAQEWEKSGFHADFLLRGKELKDVEHILTLSGNIDPHPTELMIQYVHASQNEFDRLLRNRNRWYEIRDQNIKYAPDFDLECARCGGTHTFTPSDHVPIPDKCSWCGFSAK